MPDELLDRIAEFISRHQMFRDGDRVAVAVSGGADSVFLLHALRELAPLWNLSLTVVHVEHGIRGAESVADARFVRQLAAECGLPFELREAKVLPSADNLEQAARLARHGFFAELIRRGQVDRVATGHTRSDQAETVLFRVLRGSGLAGLAGIRPVTREGLVRPLLESSRPEIEEWLKAHGIEWREDSTNQDRSYARNHLRHEVLPLLRASFNPRLDEALANLATLARDEELYWDSELLRRGPPAAQGPPVFLTSPEVTGVPRALARRIVRRAIEEAKGDLRQIEFAHVERILQMAHSTDGHDRAQLPGLDVFRSFEWIRFAPLSRNGGARDFSYPLLAPGSTELPGSATRITLQVLEKSDRPEPYATVVDELDWQRVRSLGGAPSGLELRNWRPGDQYRRVGQSKQEKIKFLFQEARVPLWERRNWPIITYNGVVLWVRRFGAAAEFAADPSTSVVLRVDESGAGSSNR
jgi:tRNA(Ile)-lysidine synthase